MDYQLWVKDVPQAIKADSLWHIEVYRLALFMAHIGWSTVGKLKKDSRTIGLSDQLYRALDSISANIAKGYSRISNKDKVRFYEYALGSARESRDWYYKGRHLLEEAVIEFCLFRLTRIIRLLLRMIPQQRTRKVKEDAPYHSLFLTTHKPQIKMNHQSWLESVPIVLKEDALWRIQAYRLALFASDIGWYDVTKVMQNKNTNSLSNPFYETLGSIGAHIAEGYSRGSNKEKARFYEYALGAARASRDWYYKTRYIQSQAVLDHRYDLLTQIIRLLSKMIPERRSRTMKEEKVYYDVMSDVMSDE